MRSCDTRDVARQNSGVWIAGVPLEGKRVQEETEKVKERDDVKKEEYVKGEGEND